MRIDIQRLLDKRKQFPVSRLKHSESDYINACLSEESELAGLILPQMFLYSVKEQDLKNKIFKQWKILGLFDLAEIWKPITGIKFVLLVLQKTESEYIQLSEYKSKDTFTGEISNRRIGIIGDQQITSSYQEYLNKLEEIINTKLFEEVSQDNYRIWKLKYSEVDINNLSLNYYNPDTRDVLDLINQEKTKPLKEIAEILRPRKLQDTKGSVVKTKDFEYPLKVKELKEEEQTTIQLQKGDILFSDSFSGQKKFHLISETNNTPLFASTFLVVIRPKSEEITPEYLFLYLQSETAIKYIRLFQRGTFFPLISSKNLQNLPVILPDKLTQKKSESIFKTLFLKEKVNLVQAINRELFDTTTPDKPFQKEFVLEELEQLRMFKREVIEKIIQGDLKELNTCIEKKLYKSFLILSGSILEAFLLDWMSEIEKKDYFSPDTEDFTLGKLIWKLKKVHAQVFDIDLIHRADKIREKRNFVHPKEYFNTIEKLDDAMCYEVIEDLKAIFTKRI